MSNPHRVLFEKHTLAWDLFLIFRPIFLWVAKQGVQAKRARQNPLVKRNQILLDAPPSYNFGWTTKIDQTTLWLFGLCFLCRERSRAKKGKHYPQKKSDFAGLCLRVRPARRSEGTSLHQPSRISFDNLRTDALKSPLSWGLFQGPPPRPRSLARICIQLSELQPRLRPAAGTGASCGYGLVRCGTFLGMFRQWKSPMGFDKVNGVKVRACLAPPAFFFALSKRGRRQFSTSSGNRKKAAHETFLLVSLSFESSPKLLELFADQSTLRC